MVSGNGVLNGLKKYVDNIGFVRQVREINKKYAEPKLKTTRAVNIALLFLRLYLIFLVILLGFKLFSMILGGQSGGMP